MNLLPTNMYLTYPGTKPVKVFLCRCSDFDGNNRVRLNVRMSHPYGIAVFEDYIFWTDWNLKSIHRADKFTGNNSVTLLHNMPIQPFDIKIYSPLRQPSGTESVLFG